MTDRNNVIQESIALDKKGLFSPATKDKWKNYWFKFRRNKFSLVGLVIVLISVFFAVFADKSAMFVKLTGSPSSMNFNTTIATFFKAHFISTL